MRITLFRLTESATLPTCGVLLRPDGIPFALTLERPWLGNRRNTSCILRGTFRAVRTRHRRFGETFLLEKVPGRSGILFHAGNLVSDTAGCILVGEKFQRFATQDGIVQSRDGFNEFMELTAGLSEIVVVVDGRTELT